MTNQRKKGDLQENQYLKAKPNAWELYCITIRFTFVF